MYNMFSVNPTILDTKVQQWRQFRLSRVAFTVERLHRDTEGTERTAEGVLCGLRFPL